jgi:hypothetical protein
MMEYLKDFKGTFVYHTNSDDKAIMFYHSRFGAWMVHTFNLLIIYST